MEFEHHAKDEEGDGQDDEAEFQGVHAPERGLAGGFCAAMVNGEEVVAREDGGEAEEEADDADTTEAAAFKLSLIASSLAIARRCHAMSSHLFLARNVSFSIGALESRVTVVSLLLSAYHPVKPFTAGIACI